MTEIPPDLPPARRSEASTLRRAPVLMKQTIPSFSDRQLQHIGDYGCFLTAKLASGPVDGPFPCVTADPMREKKKNCLGERHVFHFLTLAALSSEGLSPSHH